MTEATVSLDRARILILEDDYYLATDVQVALAAHGAVTIGPFADQEEAIRALGGERPDCAFVDINLGRGPDFDLPRHLSRLGISFAFITGYDGEALPPEFRGVPRLSKPIDMGKVVDMALTLRRA